MSRRRATSASSPASSPSAARSARGPRRRSWHLTATAPAHGAREQRAGHGRVGSRLGAAVSQEPLRTGVHDASNDERAHDGRAPGEASSATADQRGGRCRARRTSSGARRRLRHGWRLRAASTVAADPTVVRGEPPQDVSAPCTRNKHPRTRHARHQPGSGAVLRLRGPDVRGAPSARCRRRASAQPAGRAR